MRETSGILSLAGILDATLVAHVLFTQCTLVEPGAACALLGPLAVAPAQQRQGIGSALVHEGLRRLEKAGVASVYVLGDPAYYGRLGFAPELHVTTPYPLPAEWAGAWQSRSLGEAVPPSEGALDLPAPWLQPGLWAPA